MSPKRKEIILIGESKLSHVCFSTKSLEQTFQFYNGLLEFEVVHEFRNKHGDIYGMLFSVGYGTMIEFFFNEEHSNLGDVFRHFCISVPSISKIQSVFASHSMPLQISRGRTDKTLQAWVIDPNGIKLEFHEYDVQSLLYEQAKLR